MGMADIGVHVLFCKLHEDVACRNDLLGLLSGPEQVRAKRIRCASSARSFICSHVLLRLLLARQMRCAAQDVQFAVGRFGKPLLSGGKAGLHFNLSHTQGMVGVAWANVPVGFDVEARLVNEPVALAQACFNEDEVQGVMGSVQPEYMFRQYWVMKEAAMKALGVGLLRPMSVVGVADVPMNQGWQPLVCSEAGLPGSGERGVQKRMCAQWVDVFQEKNETYSWDAAVAAVIPDVHEGEINPLKVERIDEVQLHQWAEKYRDVCAA